MELEYLSGYELGKLVRTKQLSPVEVIEYFQKRTELRNPSINAFVYTKFEDAVVEAKKLEKRIMSGEDAGPFAGVPVGLKDFLPTKKGWTASHGGVPSLVTIDSEDSAFYSAARALGAIAVGKTNAPAFGFRATCDNKMYGPTSTPFNIKYNSGGSSGGTAAAVSDGLIPIGEGGDAGGSIRVPASWCGCFGFKPSAGLVPSVCRPDAWSATHPYCCGGPISRTVLDAAIMLQQMAGYDARDPISAPMDFKKFSRDLSDAVFAPNVSKLRIGYTLDFNLFPEPDAPIVLMMQNMLKALKDAGAVVEPVRFNFKHSRAAIEVAWLRGICIDTAVDMELWKRGGFEIARNDVPEPFWYWNKVALESSMMDYRTFHEVRTDILDAHLKVFEKYDIIVSPVTGCMPIANGTDGETQGPIAINGEPINPLIGFAYTHLENMCGNPAASVPMGVDALDRPAGLQVIGKRYHDVDVFRVASALEQLVPWTYEIPKRRQL